MKIITSSNKFTITAEPSKTFAYFVKTDLADFFIEGTFTTDNSGEAIVNLSDLNPIIDNWVGKVYVYDIGDISYTSPLDCEGCIIDINIDI